jgi:predicted enzyme related to lactoylglutathione lyase
MNRVVHFEIHAADLDKAQKFYSDVFGWKIQDMGPQMGNYRMINTGESKPGETWPGINGGLAPRQGPPPEGSASVNAYVCTIDVDNVDVYIEKVKSAGGTMALDKMAVPGVGWLAYMKDLEGNIFGMLQVDAAVKV